MAVAVDVRYVMDNTDKTEKSAITKQCPNWNFHLNMMYAKTMASANAGAGRIQILSNLILFVMEMCVKIIVILNIYIYISESFAEAMKLTTIGLQLRLIYKRGWFFAIISDHIHFFCIAEDDLFSNKITQKGFCNHVSGKRHNVGGVRLTNALCVDKTNRKFISYVYFAARFYRKCYRRCLSTHKLAFSSYTDYSALADIEKFRFVYTRWEFQRLRTRYD